MAVPQLPSVIFFILKSYEGRRPHIAKVFSVYFRTKVVVMKPFSCVSKNKQLISFLFKVRMMLFIFYFTSVTHRDEHHYAWWPCKIVTHLFLTLNIWTNSPGGISTLNVSRNEYKSHRCVIKYTILHKWNRSYIRHHSRLGPRVIYCMNEELCRCFDLTDTPLLKTRLAESLHVLNILVLLSI